MNIRRNSRSEVERGGGGARSWSGVTLGASSCGGEAGGGYVEDAEVGDDAVDYGGAGEREGAGGQEFGLALRGVLHDDDYAADAGDQIHGSAHAFDALAGDHPVGEVAAFGDLHGAEDGEIDVAAADHGEGVGAGEGGGAGGEVTVSLPALMRSASTS